MSQASDYSFVPAPYYGTPCIFTMSSTISESGTKRQGCVQHRCEEEVEWQWCKDTPLTETLFDAEPPGAYAVIPPHTLAHTTMKMADYGEHAWRETETLEDRPQEGAVDRVNACVRSKKHMCRAISNSGSEPSCRLSFCGQASLPPAPYSSFFGLFIYVV